MLRRPLEDRLAARRGRAALITTSAVATLAALLFVLTFSRPMSCGGRVSWHDGAIRAGLAPESRGVFDLLAALQSDWAKAGELCRGLGWPRCDRAALEEIQRRGRPSSSRGSRGQDARSAAASAVANATWAFGGEQAARAMFRTELDRIPESDGAGRARVFLRFGIIETNPDGQAALFNQACAADASLCERDRMKAAVDDEVRARFVPPGNVLPLYFTGHPPIPPAPPAPH